MSFIEDGAAEVLASLSVASSCDEILSLLETIQLRSFNSNDIRWIHAEAYAYISLDQAQKAISLLSRHLSQLEQSPFTWLLFGFAYRKLLGYENLALESYRKADQMLPNRPDILYNIANILSDIGDPSALNYYYRSLFLDPFQSKCWHNLYLLVCNTNNYLSFIHILNVSLILDPFNPEAWCNLGLKFINTAQPLKAKKAFELALSIDPLHPSSSTNIGNLLVNSSQATQALPHLQAGSGSEPSSRLNLGLCYLLLGKFEQGWDAYESRLLAFPIPIQSPRLSSLHQLSSSVDELIVWSEQGIGDSLMFVRYLLLLDCRHVKWHFYCPNSILPLFNNCLDFAGQFSSLDQLPTSSHKFNIPLLSLPKIFSTDLYSIPSFCPYIRLSAPSPTDLSIPPVPGGLSIGIVWATDPANAKMYKNKSIELKFLMSCLQPLIDLGVAHLHSFQVGRDSQQLLPWSQHKYVSDWESNLSDFNVTAYLLDQMDLIISVDTAVAHLAGAMNIPTWLLLAANADFRWLLDRSDSPWYPNTMRLFRQCSPGDWDSVISQLSDSLDSLFLLDLKSLTSSMKKKL